ncbi:MAG: tetratricopeptide repeat protein [Verrucomicrobiota bacterium]|jgi:tetratricopeptide (TPR) repeat protein
MPNESQKEPLKSFAACHLPWLLGTMMFLVYLLSLNHWITLLNLYQVATVSGWSWQPQFSNPLLFLATLPLRLLPAAGIPIVLNVFSAVCASLVLVMLARSVAILPHDRTETERLRERSDFSFLSGPLAIFPPILAVVLVGLQLSFWEQATSFTGESFEMLLFAVIVWQLLEYRLDEAPWRLYLTAFIYGAAIAESWAFVGYIPIFITAIIWLRKLDFFNLQFLARMAWCGLGGILFLFLLPIMAILSGKFHLSFWEALRPALNADWSLITSISYGDVRHQLILLSLSSFVPVLVMSIRWSANFGDSSHAGTTLVNYLFYFVHAALFTVCVWVMFDPPISARRLALGIYPFQGAAGLTFYYLTALGIGYYCGYYLLVFGKAPARSRRNNRPDPALPKSLMWLCPVIVGGTFTCAALAIGLLIYKNAPVIRTVNDDTLLQCARFNTQNIPPGGAILLSDIDALYQQPISALLAQAILAREGRLKNYPVVDTQNLKYSLYQEFLHRQFPDHWPLLFNEKQPVVFKPIGLFSMVNQIAKSNTICYLNPSFGYYFETFYQEPHGLDYSMKGLPTDTLLPPPLDKNLIDENEKFWSDVTATVSPAIARALAPPDPERRLNFGDWLLMHLHAATEANPNAIYAGTVYSRGLNFWGVQLQRAGELDRATNCFVAAQTLNPENVTAGINLDFNHKLRAGTIPPIDLSRTSPDQFGRASNWQELISENGPFDEISFTYKDALVLANDNAFFRQAVAPLTRVRQLAPDNLDVRMELAQTYVFNRLPDRALEALHDPIMNPARFGLSGTNSTGLNILLAAVYFQKKDNARGLDLMESEVRRHPDNTMLVTATVQACMLHGLYTNALAIIDQELRETPDDPKWIFAKGYAELQIGKYNLAISSLTRVMEIQTNNPTALFNRALAYLDSGDLDAARTDYTRLQSAYTNSVQVAYGLGEVAWRQHDTGEAIRNYEIYLANANTNTAEATNVIARLRELKK